MASLGVLGRMIYRLELDYQDFSDGIGITRKDLRSFSAETVAINKGLAQLSGAMIGAGTAIVAGLGLALREFAEFEKNLINVGAVSGVTGQQLEQLGDRILDLGVATATAPSELASALYEIAQAGFDVEESMTILTVSSRAAVAALTDVQTAANLISTILLAYGKSASGAAHVSDVLFSTILVGNVKFKDLSRSIGLVLPTAKALGITIEELGAAYASLTLQGLSTRQATQQLNGLFNALIKPTKALSAAFREHGIESGKALIADRGLAGAVQFLTEVSGGNETALKTLLGVQTAFRAQLFLSADGQLLYTRAMLANIEATEGLGKTQEVLNQQMQSVDFQMRQARTAIQAAAIDISRTLAPAAIAGANAVEGLATAFRGLPAPVMAVGANLGLALGAMLLFGGSLLGVTKTLSIFRESIRNMGVALTLLGGRSIPQLIAANRASSASFFTLVNAMNIAKAAATTLLSVVGSLAAIGVITVVIDFIVNDPGERILDNFWVQLSDKTEDFFDKIGADSVAAQFDAMEDVAARRNVTRQVLHEAGIDLGEGFWEGARISLTGGMGIVDKVIGDFGKTIGQLEEEAMALEGPFEQTFREVIVKNLLDAEASGVKLSDTSKQLLTDLRGVADETTAGGQTAKDLAAAWELSGEEAEDLSGRIETLGKKVSEQESAFRSAAASGLALPLTNSAKEFVAFQESLNSTIASIKASFGSVGQDLSDPFIYLQSTFKTTEESIAGLSLHLADIGAGLDLTPTAQEAFKLIDALDEARAAVAEIDAEIQSNMDTMQQWEGRISLVETVLGSATDGIGELRAKTENDIAIMRAEVDAGTRSWESFAEGSAEAWIKFQNAVDTGEVVGEFAELQAMLDSGAISEAQYYEIREAGIGIMQMANEAIAKERVETALLLPELEKRLIAEQEAAAAIGEADSKTRAFVEALKSQEAQQALATVQMLTYLASIGQIPQQQVTKVIMDLAQADPKLALLFEELGLLEGPHTIEMDANISKAQELIRALRAERDILAAKATELRIEAEMFGDQKVLEKAEALQAQVDAIDGQIATVSMAAENGDFSRVYEDTYQAIDTFEETAATADLKATDGVSPVIAQINTRMAEIQKDLEINFQFTDIGQIDSAIADAQAVLDTLEKIPEAQRTVEENIKVTDAWLRREELKTIRIAFENGEYEAQRADLERELAALDARKIGIEAEIALEGKEGIQSVDEALRLLQQRINSLDPIADAMEIAELEAQMQRIDKLRISPELALEGGRTMEEELALAADALGTFVDTEYAAKVSADPSNLMAVVELSRSTLWPLVEEPYIAHLMANDKDLDEKTARGLARASDLNTVFTTVFNADTTDSASKVEMLTGLVEQLTGGKTELNIEADTEAALSALYAINNQLTSDQLTKEFLISLDKAGVEDGVLSIEEMLQATQANLAANPIEVGASVEASAYEAGTQKIQQTNKAMSAEQVEVKFTAVGGEEVTATLDQLMARRAELESLIAGITAGGIDPGEIESLTVYRTELDHLIKVIDAASAGAGLTIEPKVVGDDAQNRLIEISREISAISDEIAVINISDPYSEESIARLGTLYERLNTLQSEEYMIRFGTDDQSLFNTIENIEERTAQDFRATITTEVDTAAFDAGLAGIQGKIDNLSDQGATLDVGVTKDQFDRQMAAINTEINDTRNKLVGLNPTLDTGEIDSALESIDNEIEETTAKLRGLWPLEPGENVDNLQAKLDQLTADRVTIEAGLDPSILREMDNLTKNWENLQQRRVQLQADFDASQANTEILGLHAEINAFEDVKDILIKVQADPTQAEQQLGVVRNRLAELNDERATLEEMKIGADPATLAQLEADIADIDRQIAAFTEGERLIDIVLAGGSVNDVLSGLQNVDGAMAELQKSGMIYIRADSEEVLREFIRVNNIDITDKNFKVFVDGTEVDNLNVKLGGEGGLIDSLNETFGPRYTAYLEAKYTPDSADGIIGQNEIIRTSFEDVATDWSAFLRSYSSMDGYDVDVRLDFLQQRLNDLGVPEGINIRMNGDDAIAVVHAVRNDIDTNLITPDFVAKLDADADGFLEAHELAVITGTDWDLSTFVAELNADVTPALQGIAQFEDATIAITDGGTTYTVYAETEQAAADILRLNRTVLDDRPIKVFVDGKEVAIGDIEEVQKYGQTVEDDGILVNVAVLDEASPVLREALKLVNDVPTETRTLLLADGTTYVEVTTAAGAAAAGLDREVTTVFDAQGNALEVVPLTLADAQKLNGTFNTELNLMTALGGGLASIITAIGLAGIAAAINAIPNSKNSTISLTMPDEATLLKLAGINSGLTKIAETAAVLTRSVVITVTEGPPQLGAIRLELQTIGFITNAELAKTVTITIVQTGSTLTTILQNLRDIAAIPAPIEKVVNVPLTGMSVGDMQAVVTKLRELAAISFAPLAESARFIADVGTSVSNLSQVAVDSLGVISDEVSAFAARFIEAGTTLADGFGRNFGGQLTGMRNEVATAFRTVTDYIASSIAPGMNTWGENVGRNFTAGIVNGMDIPMVYARAYAMAEAAYNATLNALQTGSPSRLMMQVGGYFSQGFAIGISDEASTAVNMASAMAEATGSATYQGILAQRSIIEEGGKQLVEISMSYTQAAISIIEQANAAISNMPPAQMPLPDTSWITEIGSDDGLTVTGDKDALTKYFQTMFWQNDMDWMNDFLTRISDWIAPGNGGPIYDAAKAMGKAIAEGTFTGIDQFSYLASNAVLQMIYDAMIAAKQSLGIASPSTVFMGFGEMIVRGLAQGIGDEEGAAVDAAKAMVEAIRDSIEQFRINLWEVINARRDAGLDAAMDQIAALETRAASTANLGLLPATQALGGATAIPANVNNYVNIYDAVDPKTVGDEVIRRLHGAAVRNRSAGKVAMTTV